MATLGEAFKHYQPMARRRVSQDERLCRRLDREGRRKVEIAVTFAYVAQWLNGLDVGWLEARADIDAHDAAKVLLRRARKQVARFPYASGLIDLILAVFPDPTLATRPKRGRGRPRREWLKDYEAALRDLGTTRDEARYLLSGIVAEVAADPKAPERPVPR